MTSIAPPKPKKLKKSSSKLKTITYGPQKNYTKNTNGIMADSRNYFYSESSEDEQDSSSSSEEEKQEVQKQRKPKNIFYKGARTIGEIITTLPNGDVLVKIIKEVECSAKNEYSVVKHYVDMAISGYP